MATYQSSSAYQFELFEEKKQYTQPQIKVIRNRKLERARQRAAMLRTVAAVAVFFVGIVSILFQQISLTEMTNQVSQKSSQLEQLENQHRMLSAELESSVALSNIETIITRDLGMAKLGEDQVTYMNLTEGDTLERPQESHGFFSKILSSIRDGAYQAGH